MSMIRSPRAMGRSYARRPPAARSIAEARAGSHVRRRIGRMLTRMTALQPRRARRRTRRRLWPALLVLAIVPAAAAGALLAWSGASLTGDPSALARVHVEPFGGALRSARATGTDGRVLPLAVADGRLTPRQPLGQGRRVTVVVELRRPGWNAWLLGAI